MEGSNQTMSLYLAMNKSEAIKSSLGLGQARWAVMAGDGCDGL